MKGERMTEEQKRWQREDDAMTLARYQELLNDKARLNAAKKEAKKQAEELSKRATMLNKASRTNKKNGK